ncbi:HAD family hydrolase [Glycomyces buryatensis]|uniref:HAD family phosphatase n=1 Tax=Glycomyces buryatensis TaxID=2570927 RepID=A0A4S8QFI2_9ACTN|nr:HAD family phosphatase [Glycomyces buryatensis]THV43383.1 HAD family phosphatase [Glycomyces buryatensis]
MSRPVLWFDFGGVLSPPLPDLFTLFEQKTGITPEQMHAALSRMGDDFGTAALAPIELGAMSEREWAARLAAALAALHPDLDLSRLRTDGFGAQWFEGVSANPRMTAALCRARDLGLGVGVLSNNVVEWKPYWTAIIAPAGRVDNVVDSCEVGVRKPDPEIFRLAEKAAGVPPEDCILIDDLAENCAAAEECGWSAVRFRDDDQILRELSALAGVHLS